MFEIVKNNYHIMHIHVHFLSVVATLYFRAHFLQIGKEELVGSFLLPFTPVQSYLHGGKQTNEQTNKALSFAQLCILFYLKNNIWSQPHLRFSFCHSPQLSAVLTGHDSHEEKNNNQKDVSKKKQTKYTGISILHFFFGRGRIYKRFFKTIYTRGLNISLRERPKAPSGTI